MTEIVHTADLHLGKGQYQLPERRIDIFDAFHQIVDGCLRREVDALVITGDIYDHEYPSDDTVESTIDLVSDLSSKRDGPFVPVYLIHGDHDHPPGKRNTPGVDRLIQNTHAERLDSHPTSVSDDLVLYGVHHENLSDLVDDNLSFSPPPDDTYTALCTHMMVHKYNYVGKDNAYWPFQLLKPVPFDVDVMLCGELHKRKHYPIHRTDIFYSGTPARIHRRYRDYSPSVFLHETTQESINSTKYFVPARPWNDITVSVDHDDDIEAVLSRVVEELNLQNRERRMILEVTLDGENDDFTQSEVKSQLEDWPGVLHASVNATSPNQGWIPGVPR
ncbi:DNA repair exonuclease [Natrinema marinum]|uniref:DNA repair exonuclease n=1 Tax=Natrinema marinum TaxID=2961598 RepID=UPI0020C8D6B5|nr:metallophosphoesterase [Natrinema marinum]